MTRQTISEHGSRSTSSLRRFFYELICCDDSGVYSVEFALLAVPFFGLLMAYGELSYINFANQILIDQLQRATRVVQTGQVQTATTPINTAKLFLSEVLCPTPGSVTNFTSPTLFANFFDCSPTGLMRLDISTASSLDISSISGSSTSVSNLLGKSQGQLKYCLAVPGNVVLIRALYYLPAILPLSIYGPSAALTQNTGSGSGNTYYHAIFATSAVETEAYSGTVTAPTTC